MTASLLVVFAVTSLVAIATPGPTVLLALANGARFGRRAALAGIAGALLSDLVLISAAAVGLGALLAASEVLFEVVKWIGAAYLAYLGIRLLRTPASAALEVPESSGAGRPRTLFAKCFLVAVTNPKGLLFTSALLPQFIDAAAPQLPQYATLAVLFVAIDGAVMLAYALLGARVKQSFQGNGVLWLNRGCGATLLGLAGALALYRRSNA